MTEQEMLNAIAFLSRYKLLDRGDIIRESCIASTKVATEVMRTLGILARPLVVAVYVFNAPMVRRLSNGAKPEPGNAEKWFDEDGSWSVGVDHSPNPTTGAFSGHMVVIANNEYLVDASLDQASRPDRNLPLRPAVIRFNDREKIAKFLAGGPENRESTINNHNAVIVYEAFPGDGSYRGSKDWKLWQKRYGEIVIDVTRTVRQIEAGDIDNRILEVMEKAELPEAPSNAALRRPGPLR